jgi:DmsE family decaheme c-type cytochrome
MSTWLRVLAALSLPLALGVGAGWAAQAPTGAVAFSPCSDCHDTLVPAFLTNPHATAGTKLVGKAICESCHGDGTKHAESGGETSLIKVPKGAVGANVCLSCHQATHEFDHTATGFHAGAGVNCTDCHSIHDATATPLLHTATAKLCVSCHLEQKMQFGKPYAHRIGRGGIECTSCHNPHGGTGAEQSLKLTRAGELPCISCHTETQGPFVFTHVTGIAGNCMTCHEPHGSNNAKMLTRSRVDQVCLECHTTLPTGLLGPQPPSVHDLRSARYTNCTTCHVAIHGSNSSPMLFR